MIPTRLHIIWLGKLFLPFALMGLLSCQSDDKLTGVAAGAAGRYVVTTYIVSGDTLFSIRPGATGYVPEINKIGVEQFTVAIDVTASDRLTVRTDYWRSGLRSTASKEVVVRLTNSDYQFSLLNLNASAIYEGYVGRFTGFFYERMVGGVLIPPVGSPTSPSPSSSQEVIIVAQPAK